MKKKLALCAMFLLATSALVSPKISAMEDETSQIQLDSNNESDFKTTTKELNEMIRKAKASVSFITNLLKEFLAGKLDKYEPKTIEKLLEESGTFIGKLQNKLYFSKYKNYYSSQFGEACDILHRIQHNFRNLYEYVEKTKNNIKNDCKLAADKFSNIKEMDIKQSESPGSQIDNFQNNEQISPNLKDELTINDLKLKYLTLIRHIIGHTNYNLDWLSKSSNIEKSTLEKVCLYMFDKLKTYIENLDKLNLENSKEIRFCFLNMVVLFYLRFNDLQEFRNSIEKSRFIDSRDTKLIFEDLKHCFEKIIKEIDKAEEKLPQLSPSFYETHITKECIFLNVNDIRDKYEPKIKQREAEKELVTEFIKEIENIGSPEKIVYDFLITTELLDTKFKQFGTKDLSKIGEIDLHAIDLNYINEKINPIKQKTDKLVNMFNSSTASYWSFQHRDLLRDIVWGYKDCIDQLKAHFNDKINFEILDKPKNSSNTSSVYIFPKFQSTKEWPSLNLTHWQELKRRSNILQTKFGSI